MNWRWILRYWSKPCSHCRGSGSKTLLGSYLTSFFSVQRWNRLLLLGREIVQFLTYKDVHCPWNKKCYTYCKRRFNSQDRKIYYTQHFDIDTFGLVPSRDLNLKDLANIGAHYCKVLTLIGIPISFSHTFRWISPEPNTVIRCKSSMQYDIFSCVNRKSKSSRNCSQCTNCYWNDLNRSTVANSSDLVF